MRKQDLLDKLKAARKAQGLTCAELGEKMGMTRSNGASSISARENGAPPNFDSLTKWVHALGFTLELVADVDVCPRSQVACEVTP